MDENLPLLKMQVANATTDQSPLSGTPTVASRLKHPFAYAAALCDLNF
jgi:hypothetical protein